MKNKQSPNVQQSIEALAMKEYPVLNDREKVWGNDIVTDLNLGSRHAFTKGHSMGEDKVIQEIEGWVKVNNHESDESPVSRKVVYLSDLIKQIQTLKK